MVLTFNSFYRNGPAYIKNALNWYTPPRDLRSRNIPSLIPVKSRSIRLNNRLLQGGSATHWHSLLKARCTPKKLTILTKHSKTFFFNHVVKNIVNYQLQKLYLKWTCIKGSNYAFATWCHSALKYL